MEGGGELSRFIRKGRKKADKGRIETHLHSPGFKGWVYVYGEFGNPLGERERDGKVSSVAHTQLSAHAKRGNGGNVSNSFELRRRWELLCMSR